MEEVRTTHHRPVTRSTLLAAGAIFAPALLTACEEHVGTTARDGIVRGSRTNNARVCSQYDVAALYRAAR